MAEPLRADRVPPAAGDTPPRVAEPAARERTARDRWHELRSLLVGPERDRLSRVEEKLDDPHLYVDDVSKVLPEAVKRRAHDPALSDALGPVVGEAIKASVRRDPQPLVDAIFPVIGPAIRRAISASFAELVQSINATLEHALSPRGLAWRVEALRTGKSFGEVVLRHSLLFRVEQLFLVHRDTGLLVTHLSAPGVKAPPPEMVAGMLTAITDFARDSFAVSRQQGLDSLALGDLTVWVEQGPMAALAAVIRGHAPVALRERLQQAVEGVHRFHAGQLERFGREGAPFDVQPEVLESCLVSQLAEPSRSPGRWRVLAMAGLVFLGLGWCVGPRYLESRRFGRYIDVLRREPGVVVGSTGRAGGRFVVTGLRDPLARDPVQLLAAERIDSARVTAHWEPYIALRPEFVIHRAGTALQPPGTVHLVMRGDTLGGSGVASSAWIENARRLARAVAGVGAVDFSQVRDSVDVALRAAADDVERRAIAFQRGDAFPTGAYDQEVDSIATRLRHILAGAGATGREVHIEVRGSTDSVGTEATNAMLRESRARMLRSMLLARGIPPSVVTINPDSASGGRHASLRLAIRSSLPASP
ncbi:MAG: hypothetical protein ACT4P7_05955 [Gemmatimonadaceae bacterium]